MKKIVKKLSFGIFLIGSMLMSSCGGGGGVEEELFKFKSSDLTNKYWYASTFIDDSYEKNDIVIVYRFNSGGDLYKQEYSGRRDSKVGTWSLKDDNVLIINDETLTVIQEWKIDKSSTKDQINLKSTGGIRTFYTQKSELADVTADAFLVKNVYLKDGDYVARYRYDFEVKGEKIARVTALVSSNDRYELVKMKNSRNESVWKVKEEDTSRYLSGFPGEKMVKFVLKMESGEEHKLEEKIYNKEIDALDYSLIDSDHKTGTGLLSLDVEWKALSDEKAYYYIQILNSNKDENKPLYTTNWQPASDGGMQLLKLQESSVGEFGLQLGDRFYVKVVAFLFEDGINPFQGVIHSFNVQACSQFIKAGGEW